MTQVYEISVTRLLFSIVVSAFSFPVSTCKSTHARIKKARLHNIFSHYNNNTDQVTGNLGLSENTICEAGLTTACTECGKCLD